VPPAPSACGLQALRFMASPARTAASPGPAMVSPAMFRNKEKTIMHDTRSTAFLPAPKDGPRSELDR